MCTCTHSWYSRYQSLYRGRLVKGVFSVGSLSRVSSLPPSHSHSLHRLPSSIPALLSERSLAAHAQSSLCYPETKSKHFLSVSHEWWLHTAKFSRAVTLTLDAMALSLPSRDGFVYTTSSSMSPSFSPSITAQLSAPGISHSLLADITKREYLYSNLAERVKS